MYASSFCTLPAEFIYDKSQLATYMPVVETCHIYMIGYLPRIDVVDAQRDERGLHITFEVLGARHTVNYDIPISWDLKSTESGFHLEDSDGQCYWPDPLEAQHRLSIQSGLLNFHVKYIGQAYGQDGSRNALDRLLKHETLQRISLLGTPDGHRLSLLLLSIEARSQLFTVFNPFAKNKDDEGERIRNGIDKLYNTSQAEQTTLFEASLIRYFYPEFNKEFKDSFPSTNLKVLRDCYEKDFSALIAEIWIEGLPFRLMSETVPPKSYHIAKHDLHRSEERKIFFGVD